MKVKLKLEKVWILSFNKKDEPDIYEMIGEKIKDGLDEGSETLAEALKDPDRVHDAFRECLGDDLESVISTEDIDETDFIIEVV